MNKDDIKRVVDQPGLIPGIFNYCDRWCERCPMTSRCATYAMEQEQFPEGYSNVENKLFWEKMQELFQATLEMITESAEEMGIDLDSLDDDEVMHTEEEIREKIDNHHCTVWSSDYMQAVTDWFESAETLLQAKEDELNRILQLGTHPKEGEQLTDALEVIRWYQYQIHVKTKRALHGKFDTLLPEDDDYPKDSDGSAKVALLGIDRSLAAWGILLNSFPEKEDATLQLLIKLEKLRRALEKEFPDARAFIRPGFDD